MKYGRRAVAASKECRVDERIFGQESKNLNEVATRSLGAPLFHNIIALGNDPNTSVDRDVLDEKRGLALASLFPSVPKALRQHPEQIFYELLVLVDAIRSGRTRECNVAIKLLKEKLEHTK